MSKTVRIPRRSRAGILAAIILGICLLLLLTVGVLTVGAADAHPPRLVDNAGLLSQAEADSLRATLDQYSEELNFDIVVVTTNTLDGKTPRDYADDYFDYNGYGYGANRDGALFLRYINGSSKEVWLSTSGEGIKAIRDADIESISTTWRTTSARTGTVPPSGFLRRMCGTRFWITVHTTPYGFLSDWRSVWESG